MQSLPPGVAQRCKKGSAVSLAGLAGSTSQQKVKQPVQTIAAFRKLSHFSKIVAFLSWIR